MKDTFLFYLGLFPVALRKFSENAFNLLLAFFVFGVVAMIPNIIPILGAIVSLVLTAIMLIGMWGFLLKIVDGGKPELNMLFAHTNLWLHASLAHLVAALATGLVVAIVMGIGIAIGASMGEAGVLIGILFMPIVVIVAMLFMFWPAFVSDQKRNPFDALGDSCKFVIGNIPAMLALLVVLFGAGVVSTLIIALLSQVSLVVAMILNFIWFLIAGPTIALMVAMVFRKLAPAAPVPAPAPISEQMPPPPTV